MGTNKQHETAAASQAIAELKIKANDARDEIASWALAIARTHDAMDCALSRETLNKRAASYLLASADYYDAMGFAEIAANYRSDAAALERRAK